MYAVIDTPCDAYAFQLFTLKYKEEKQISHDASELRPGNKRISEIYHRGHRTGSAMNRDSVLVNLYDHVV